MGELCKAMEGDSSVSDGTSLESYDIFLWLNLSRTAFRGLAQYLATDELSAEREQHREEEDSKERAESVDWRPGNQRQKDEPGDGVSAAPMLFHIRGGLAAEPGGEASGPDQPGRDEEQDPEDDHSRRHGDQQRGNDAPHRFCRRLDRFRLGEGVHHFLADEAAQDQGHRPGY